MLNTGFPIRKDLYGLRYVFFLGNEGGDCKYRCTFCEIGKSNKVSNEYNITLFENLYKDYSEQTKGEINHPLIYNRGNVTDEKAFSRRTLKHVLEKFNNNSKITNLSINSREKEVTNEFIDFIMQMNLSYPVHFILGQESFSDKTYQIIGKNSQGEYERLVNKLISFNQKGFYPDNKTYNFGIDCNLLFLPELYIGASERLLSKKEIENGFVNDIKKALEISSENVPLTLNLHPYYKVKSLPYENADIEHFIEILPNITELVKTYNNAAKFKTSIFIGFRGLKTGNEKIDRQINAWNKYFDNFNETNNI